MDLDFRDLAVEVSRHQGLAQQFYTVHLGFGTASSVIPAPSLPDCASEIS
jgi:hypothetical protein